MNDWKELNGMTGADIWIKYPNAKYVEFAMIHEGRMINTYCSTRSSSVQYISSHGQFKPTHFKVDNYSNNNDMKERKIQTEQPTPQGEDKKPNNVMGCVTALVSMGVIGYVVYVLCSL